MVQFQAKGPEGVGWIASSFLKMNRSIQAIEIVVMLLSLSGCVSIPVKDPGNPETTASVGVSPVRILEDRSGCVASTVPVDSPFDPFYEKYCDADGIPIISSGNVDDLALQQAYYLIMNILAPLPKVRRELIANGAYVGIIGINEQQTTLPEYAHLESEYWDQRARGLGGSLDLPITSIGEENLLCLPRDDYYGESILVHEFAHTIGLMGLGDDYEPLLEEITGIYESALQQGLWQNTYAGSSLSEYWAKGVQTYFNTNLQSATADGVHNFVNTRQELAEYDPLLYEFIARFFHNFKWTPTCPNRG